RRGDRHGHVDHGRHGDRAVPRQQLPRRGETHMTTLHAAGAPPASSRGKSRDWGHIASRVLVYALLILFAVVFLLPVYMVLMTSFKGTAEVNISTMWQFPNELSTDAFQTALQRLAPGLTNSFMLVVPATIISAVLGSINGYVLSKWKFRGANIIFPL